MFLQFLVDTACQLSNLKILQGLPVYLKLMLIEKSPAFFANCPTDIPTYSCFYYSRNGKLPHKMDVPQLVILVYTGLPHPSSTQKEKPFQESSRNSPSKQVTMGSSTSNEIVLKGPLISRSHAQLELDLDKGALHLGFPLAFEGERWKLPALFGCNFPKNTGKTRSFWPGIYIYIFLCKHVNENVYVFFDKGSLGSYVFRLKTVLKTYQSKFCAYVLLLWDHSPYVF